MADQVKKEILQTSLNICGPCGSIVMPVFDRDLFRRGNAGVESPTNEEVDTKINQPKDNVVKRLVKNAEGNPVTYHEEVEENGVPWRLLYVHPEVADKTDTWFTSRALKEVQISLPKALEMWNTQLASSRVRFVLKENGVRIRLVNSSHIPDENVLAHNEYGMKEGRRLNGAICIAPQLIKTVEERDACPTDTISGAIQSIRSGCFMDFDARSSSRVKSYAKFLAHELGHEALANSQEPDNGIMTRYKDFEYWHVTNIEAAAFAKRVWSEGSKKEE